MVIGRMTDAKFRTEIGIKEVFFEEKGKKIKSVSSYISIL